MSLRNYLAPTARETYEDAILAEITTRQCADKAHEILTDGQKLHDHDGEWELWTGKENLLMESALARCFSNLAQARKGEQIGIDAILASLTGLYETWHGMIAEDLEVE